MSAVVRKPEKSARVAATPPLIAGALREAIARGEIEPGAPLRQDRIALEFRVSHIPVREALKELVAAGLAVFVQNRGVIVSELSAEVAWELTEYRCLLEGQMARWAVPALSSLDIAEAKNILDRLDRTTKTSEILALNTAFHAALFRPANRPFFLKSIESVRANLARYWRLAWEDLGHKPRSQQSHRKILTLCRKGDADAVGREMEVHIRETGRLIVSYLRRQSESD
ncbi:MAG TPA: GntR family transcriptional regulator [Xanthobacteraceae bacterium]|jgi:DNA-binding GntR family transcriptional regulator|nr:GntR family transcriptional regulator [Xanthobacteraceae bacterium]